MAGPLVLGVFDLPAGDAWLAGTGAGAFSAVRFSSRSEHFSTGRSGELGDPDVCFRQTRI